MSKIEHGKTALIVYKVINTANEALIEATKKDNPASFSFGTNQLIPEFENKLLGLSAGDTFDFILKAHNAFGPVDAYAIMDIPLDTFEVDGKVDPDMIQVGNIIPLTDNEGRKHPGKIINVMEDAVTMDFNHPLAGKDLRFTGQIIEVKS